MFLLRVHIAEHHLFSFVHSVCVHYLTHVHWLSALPPGTTVLSLIRNCRYVLYSNTWNHNLSGFICSVLSPGTTVVPCSTIRTEQNRLFIYSFFKLNTILVYYIKSYPCVVSFFILCKPVSCWDPLWLFCSIFVVIFFFVPG